MSNDPFAFIGSNANYQPQNQLDYQNTADSYPRNYAQQPLTNYNHPATHPATHQPKQYHPSAHQINYSNPQIQPSNPHNIHHTNSHTAPTQRRHAVATFGPGGMLVTSFPFVANRFEIVNGKSVPRSLNLSRISISKVQVNTKVNDLFNGPLVSSFTRKKTAVLDLLKDIKTRQCNQDTDYLWKLLIMLVENDGILLDEKNDQNSWSAIKKIIDYIPVVNSDSTAFETIQALLIQGNSLGACDYAQATNLWSHALIIASFLDSETYSNTLSGFLESEFTPGMKYQGLEVQEHEELIPLQVIYNLFVLQVLNSGQKWNWKVVLSIILANPTANNLTAICSIGDELGKMNLLAAAHFCYLLCFMHSAVNELDLSRLFLVSSDHINQPCFFKNYEAIQMTELLEYAKSLNGSMIPHFQPYKLAFAMELADLGMTDLAAEYLLATQSILSDYKGILRENYKVLSEVVDEVCDRQSVHLSNGASNGKKHAGWFTKGLDSLMSAAVGETLDNTDAKKKARKYSRSNMDLGSSPSGSMHSMARIDSVPASDIDMNQQFSMSSKSESVTYYGVNSSNTGDQYYTNSSGAQNYEATFTYQGNHHPSYNTINHDQNQRLNSSSNSPIPSFNQNSIRNYHDGSHPVNPITNQEGYLKKMTAGPPNEPAIRNVSQKNVGYPAYQAMPPNPPQIPQAHQRPPIPSNKNINSASIYHENSSDYTNHSMQIPSSDQVTKDSSSVDSPNIFGERNSPHFVDQGQMGSRPMNVPSNPVPDKATESARTNETFESNSKPEATLEKAWRKQRPWLLRCGDHYRYLEKSSKENASETSGPIKAKLGQELSCYFDEATGKWVFPDAPQTSEAAPLPPPPQTKAPPPTQNNSAATSRQPSPAPSGAASPAPLSSTPKPTYIGALGGSSRGNRRTARSKYVDVLNPSGQGETSQPSFDFTPINNFGSAEPKIMQPMFTPTTTYSSYPGEQDSYGQTKQSPKVSQESLSPKVSQESSSPQGSSKANQARPAMSPQIRPGARSPQNTRIRPNPPNQMRPQNMNRTPQNGPAIRPAGMNRPIQSGGIPPSSGRPGMNIGGIPPTNRSGYTRPNGPSLTTNAPTFAANRPNIRPAVGRPSRPMNPSSSRAPDDI